MSEAVDGSKTRRSIKERLGEKVNPFDKPTTDAVSRSADFRRIAMLPRRERWIDYSEALTLVFAKAPLRPNTCPPKCPCGGSGWMKLRPQQGWALGEFLEQRGGFALLGPGAGKTLISLLLAPLMGWQRAVLFIPAGLRQKTVKIDYPLLSRHWYLPPLEGPGNLEVRSYEELSRENFADYLAKRRVPDGIIGDEAHAWKSRSSGRSKRILRHFTNFDDTEFCGMSGSVVHRSAMDYGHMFNWALKDTSPVPHSFVELKTWADAIDDGVPEFMRPHPGALMDFCTVGETVRDGYRRRLLETSGIVSSPDLSTNIGLNVNEIPHPEVPKVIVDAFHRMRNTSELPGGEVATSALDQTRHARELFLGFYLRWLWPNGVVDREWLKKRRAWRKYVRKMTARSHRGLWLDTEAQVAKAVVQGLVECSENESTVDGRVIRSDVDVYAEWVEIREDRRTAWDGQKEPPKETVWLSDYMLVEMERWARESIGIVWIENIGCLDKLRERGNVCFGAGENEIEMETGNRSVFASFSHKTGKNLQMFNRMLFSNPLHNGKDVEQGLGREHRPGCKYWDASTKKMEIADEVTADVYLGCRETWWSFERSRADARYIEATMGQPQRLNMAAIVSTPDDVVTERFERGDPLWAETGFAKIDGKTGGVIGVDADGNDIRSATHMPILTALKQRAKDAASGADVSVVLGEDDDVDEESDETDEDESE